MTPSTAQTHDLWHFEKELYSKGIFSIAGVDEVGVGPLAGPVVAAAVILPSDKKEIFCDVNDSKKLSPHKREILFEVITKHAIGFAIAQADIAEIDTYNVYHASILAMERSVSQLLQQTKIEYLLIDFKKLKNISLSQTSLVKGDSRSASIAAASIIAKVYRDNLMIQYHKEYPQFGFDAHKGYPTKQHFEALKKFGPSPIHRMSYKPVQLALR